MLQIEGNNHLSVSQQPSNCGRLIHLQKILVAST